MTSGAERHLESAALLLRESVERLEDALAHVADESPHLRSAVGAALRVARQAKDAVNERRGEQAKQRLIAEAREPETETFEFPRKKASG